MIPYCEVCSTNHHGHQAHVWPKVVVNKVVPLVVNSRTKDRHKKTEERRVYMRDKMRQRRSAK